MAQQINEISVRRSYESTKCHKCTRAIFHKCKKQILICEMTRSWIREVAGVDRSVRFLVEVFWKMQWYHIKRLIIFSRIIVPRFQVPFQNFCKMFHHKLRTGFLKPFLKFIIFCHYCCYNWSIGVFRSSISIGSCFSPWTGSNVSNFKTQRLATPLLQKSSMHKTSIENVTNLVHHPHLPRHPWYQHSIWSSRWVTGSQWEARTTRPSRRDCLSTFHRCSTWPRSKLGTAWSK